MTISRNVVAGNTFMLLLKLLSEKDMYGYEMIAVLGKRSDNVFELKMELFTHYFTVWRGVDILTATTER